MIRTLFVLSLAAASAQAGQSGPEYFGNAVFTTQDGKEVRFYDDVLANKNVVVNLIYTRCTASCPLETAKLAQVQRLLGDRMGKDIFFYSISIDPKHDTPEVLKAYAAKFHAGKGWTFLHGSIDDVKLVSKKLGLSSLTDASTRDGHQPSLMIGNDARGEWMRNSAVDNPRFLALTILHFFYGYGAATPASYTMAKPIQAGRGEILFKARCAACHTVGGGDAIGPDLSGIATRRDHGWLVRYVAEPDVLLAQGDATARALFARYKSVRMPNLELSTSEAETVLGYVEGVSR